MMSTNHMVRIKWSVLTRKCEWNIQSWLWVLHQVLSDLWGQYLMWCSQVALGCSRWPNSWQRRDYLPEMGEMQGNASVKYCESWMEMGELAGNASVKYCESWILRGKWEVLNKNCGWTKFLENSLNTLSWHEESVFYFQNSFIACFMKCCLICLL